MKKFIKILSILWTAFCVIGILGNFSKYGFADWVTIVFVVSIPYVILGWIYKKINSKGIKNELDEAPEQVLTPTYIETDHMIHKVDGAITDDEIPYLIEITKQKALEQYEKSNNPKFHRTYEEDELSFSFSKQYADSINIFETSFQQAEECIGKVNSQWIKNATKDELLEKISLCQNAINIFEKYKEFCYSKGKGGTIYFQDTWEYCHNSKNECFSYIEKVIKLKTKLEKYL